VAAERNNGLIGDRRGVQVALAPTAALSRLAQWAAAAFGWLLAPLALGRDWDPSDAVITLRADLGIDVAARLDHIVAPTLIISGARDPSYPPALTAELAARLPAATRVVYPRTGHGVILHRRFVGDLRGFLHGADGCGHATASDRPPG
jgi:pimeloyl-ACP methyl ester carboxylesterase